MYSRIRFFCTVARPHVLIQRFVFSRGAQHFSTSNSSVGVFSRKEPEAYLDCESEEESLTKPLAFVNRYAEALDILVPNLANQECLREGLRVKYITPLAAQPPGTGKTALGENITAILRRPRESDIGVETAIATRLKTAWCWQDGAPSLHKALNDIRNENLVMRTLMARYPHHEETLLKLKYVKPLIIEMKTLVTPEFGFRFDRALAYAIFCAARGLRSTETATEDTFLAQRKSLQTSSGMVIHLIKEGNGAPVMLILDDITDLEDPDFSDYFNSEQQKTPLYRAMTKLSRTLQLLHSIPLCFVFCTGRSLWLSSRALLGSGSPLIVHPTLLQPLTAADVEQSLRLTSTVSGRFLSESMGVAAPLIGAFTEQVVKLTGGVGRAVQFVLRARQSAVLGGSPVLNSIEEIREALDRLLPRIPKIAGVLLRITWDGPADAVLTKEIPTWRC
jgi:hypothetical protein